MWCDSKRTKCFRILNSHVRRILVFSLKNLKQSLVICLLLRKGKWYKFINGNIKCVTNNFLSKNNIISVITQEELLAYFLMFLIVIIKTGLRPNMNFPSLN